MKKKFKRGFSILIASLSFNESALLDEVMEAEEDRWSLPTLDKASLWQAYHTSLKRQGQELESSLGYVRKKSRYLKKAFRDVQNEKENGSVLENGFGFFIFSDICLPIATGLEEDIVLDAYKSVLAQLDVVVFVDRPLSSQEVVHCQNYLGKENVPLVREVMLRLCKRFGWLVVQEDQKNLIQERIDQLSR